jgi:hypothetical protein
MERTDAKPVTAAGAWRIMLPPGWVTIPTDREAAARKIGQILDTALSGKPRDELIHFRIELDRSLRLQIRDARRSGATHVHALVRPIAGLPVSASFSTVPVDSPDVDELALALSAVLGEAEDVVELGHVDLQDRGALRRIRRTPGMVSTGQGNRQIITTFVDYVVPLDDTSVLVFAFSTSTEPVHEELVTLFDAIVTTLHRAP